MDESVSQMPTIRRERNFVVEEHVDAVRFPEECAGCGSPAHDHDEIRLEKKFKNLGLIKIKLSGIPYCPECYKKTRASKRLDKAIWVLAFVFGIPLAIWAIANQAASQSSGTSVIMISVEAIICILIAYGFFWLVIELPMRKIFKNRYVEPISANIIEEKKRDGREGLSVVIRIPNPAYADKFALLNGVPLGGGR